jgi:hypothetical protein
VGGDQRGTGDGERLPHVLSTSGVVYVVLKMRRSVRVEGQGLLAADELGARGGSKGGAGSGKQPWRALQTQEVVKGMPRSTAGPCFQAARAVHRSRGGDGGSVAARNGSVGMWQRGTVVSCAVHAAGGAGRG